MSGDLLVVVTWVPVVEARGVAKSPAVHRPPAKNHLDKRQQPPPSSLSSTVVLPLIPLAHPNLEVSSFSQLPICLDLGDP